MECASQARRPSTHNQDIRLQPFALRGHGNHSNRGHAGPAQSGRSRRASHSPASPESSQLMSSEPRLPAEGASPMPCGDEPRVQATYLSEI